MTGAGTPPYALLKMLQACYSPHGSCSCHLVPWHGCHFQRILLNICRRNVGNMIVRCICWYLWRASLKGMDANWGYFRHGMDHRFHTSDSLYSFLSHLYLEMDPLALSYQERTKEDQALYCCLNSLQIKTSYLLTFALKVSRSAFRTLLLTAASLYFWLISPKRFSSAEFSTLNSATCQ